MTSAPPRVLLLQGPLTSSGRDYFTTYALNRGLLGEEEALVPFDARANVLRVSHFFRRLGWHIVYTGWVQDGAALQALAPAFDALELLDPEPVQDPSFFRVIRNNRALMYQAIAHGAEVARARWGDESLVLRLRSDLWLDPTLLAPAMRLLGDETHRRTLLASHLVKHDLRHLPDFVFGARAAPFAEWFQSLRRRAEQGQSHSTHVHHDLMAELLARRDLFGTLITGSRALLHSFVWRGCPFLGLLDQFDPDYLKLDQYLFDSSVNLDR